MRISELIRIDRRFEKSVNLLLDLNDIKKCKDYIPTRSSVRILASFMREISGFSGDRANILIGPYGKGKSHLLLVLLALLSHKKTEEAEKLIEKIRNTEPELAEEIRDASAGRSFLPVILNTGSGNLGQAFVRSLAYALKRDGLNDVIPDSYFTEAVKTILQWKSVFPNTYKAFEKSVGDPDKFIKCLEDGDYETLEVFRRIHPQLTSGSLFNPVVDDDVISVYRSVNRSLCEKHGYTGIYIVFDEFSKYIEGHTAEGFAADMKVLQDICELCNSSKDEQLHITCVAHKAIRAYGESLTKEVRNAFMGVEGRLHEILFIVSSQNNYELIADAVHKKSGFSRIVKTKEFIEFANDSYHIPDFLALFEKSDFDIIVSKGCYPLTPLSAFLLLNMSEKEAQNERTIFTFLTGGDPNGLPALSEQERDGIYIGAHDIYRYFEPLFSSSNDPFIHNEWLMADYAISKCETDNERAVIKAFSTIRMVNRPDDVPATAEFIRLATGFDKDMVDHILDTLIYKNVIVYRKADATYDYRNTTNVSLDDAVTDTVTKYFKEIDIAEVLNEACKNRYILPGRFNQDHSMTRYYRVVYMNAAAFSALSSKDYLSDDNRPDGYIIGICSGNMEEDAISDRIISINDNTVAGFSCLSLTECSETASKWLAVRKLRTDKKFLEENELFSSELSVYEERLSDELNFMMGNAIRNCEYLYTSEGAYACIENGFNRAVNMLCEKTYIKTPFINNELINRHQISAQISKARNNIMEDVLLGRSLAKYESGTSAEATIYRAVFLYTAKDAALKNIRDEIIKFIHSCKGQKVSFAKLIERLTSAPYGLRKGVIPLYIAEQLTELDDLPVIYLGKKELTVEPSVIVSAVNDPNGYSLYVEVETAEKLEYLEGLEATFPEYGTYCRETDGRTRLSRISCVMQSWYRSLPQTSRMFTIPDYEGQNIKEIASFRKLFRDDVNPRELLFDTIPSVLKEKSFAATLKKVKKIKKETDQHISRLKGLAVMEVRRTLGVSNTDDFRMCLNDWYAGISESVKNAAFSSSSQGIMNCLRDLGTGDAETIVERLSKEATGFYIEDWTDTGINAFTSALEEFINEISEKKKRSGAATERKILITGTNGVSEYSYDFDHENMTPSGYFLSNQIDDILGEFGESVDNNEKIGILVNAVKKIMGIDER